MPVATQLTIEEYLSTSYRPDCDFIENHIEERNVGKFDHSNLQRALIGILFQREREWGIRVLPEQRIRVSAKRVRIPDICIIPRDMPIEQVLSSPPSVCIEILSEGDTLASTKERMDDYRGAGVPNLWVIDPTKRLAWVYEADGYRPVSGKLAVQGSPIQLGVQEVFLQLD